MIALIQTIKKYPIISSNQKKDNSNKKKAHILAINQVFLSAFAKLNFLLKCFERMFVLLNILKINKQ
jgi:hypothetical protein